MPDAPSDGWLASFVADFQHRFINLLAFQFRAFPARLALRLLAKKLVLSVADEAHKDVYVKPLTDTEIRFFLSNDDLSRLGSYARNYVDYHMILDTIPEIARLYFNRRFGDLAMSALQETILIGQGLQHKTIDELLAEFPKVASAQLLSLFNRSVIKIYKALQVRDPRGYLNVEYAESGGRGRRPAENEGGGEGGECAEAAGRDAGAGLEKSGGKSGIAIIEANFEG